MKPFNLEKALVGEPVVLRGSKNKEIPQTEEEYEQKFRWYQL